MDILYKLENFYLRIKRILEWLPILWRTHDWDHGYATQIWAYSLERLRDSMVNGVGVVGPAKLRKINTAINLLKRISRDQEYTDLDLDLLIRQYGPLGIPGIDSNPWPKEATKKLIDLSKKERYLYKQDVRLLSKILERNLGSWWD